ncbi:MAG: hypothetical protein AAGA53_09465 [Pseudomonadota bacterium]
MQTTPYSIILSGYLVSVVTSALFGTFFLLFPFEVMVGGGFTNFLQIASFFFLTGACFIFPTAMPGFAFIVYLAGKHNWHQSGFYTIGGAVNALFAHVLLWAVTGNDFNDALSLPLLSVFAGAFGGWAYYFFRRKTLRL